MFIYYHIQLSPFSHSTTTTPPISQLFCSAPLLLTCHSNTSILCLFLFSNIVHRLLPVSSSNVAEPVVDPPDLNPNSWCYYFLFTPNPKTFFVFPACWPILFFTSNSQILHSVFYFALFGIVFQNSIVPPFNKCLIFILTNRA